MLSRVAERVYWLGRYLERAENTARLIDVYGGLLLDLPASAGLNWRIVTEIIDGPGHAHGGGAADTLDYLLSDAANPGSLVVSLSMARENARTTRDILPAEAWRAINELYLAGRDGLGPARAARQRHQVMAEIVERVQGLTGLLDGTMSHGDAYQFVRLGRNLERGDMTTRIIDVAAALLMVRRDELAELDNTLWMAVLRCASGYQMYRQHVRRRIVATDVIGFLLKDEDFPRSVRHCLAEAGRSLARLPRAEAVLPRVRRTVARLDGLAPVALDEAGVHALIDELQVEIAAVSEAVAAHWFYPTGG